MPSTRRHLAEAEVKRLGDVVAKRRVKLARVQREHGSEWTIQREKQHLATADRNLSAARERLVAVRSG